MPSNYCLAYPDDGLCLMSGGTYNPSGAPQTTGGGNVLPFPIPTQQPNQGSVVYPKSTPTTTLDKILATALSTVALLTRQNSIPTAQQQYQYPAYNPYAPNPYGGEIPAGSYAGRNNTLGNLENWVKTHTFETVIIGALIAFYLIPSPVKRRNGLAAVSNPKRRTKKRARRR